MTFSIVIETTAPPSPIQAFEMAVWNLAYATGANLIDKIDAVDQAQRLAEESGVFTQLGADHVQMILAEAFRSE